MGMKTLGAITEFLAVSVASWIAVALNGLLLAESNLGVPVSILAAVSIASVLYLLLRAAVRSLCSLLRLHKLFIRAAALEGDWVEIVDKESDSARHLVCHVKIDYDTEVDMLVFHGIALWPEGTIHADWRSTSTRFDSGKVIYSYEANMLDGSEVRVAGMGEVTFSGSGWGFTRGNGYFVETGNPLTKCNYSIDRVTTRELRGLIGKSHVKTNDDIKRLAGDYYAKYGNSRSLHN